MGILWILHYFILKFGSTIQIKIAIYTNSDLNNRIEAFYEFLVTVLRKRFLGNRTLKDVAGQA